jgi:hypothetical protein
LASALLDRVIGLFGRLGSWTVKPLWRGYIVKIVTVGAGCLAALLLVAPSAMAARTTCNTGFQNQLTGPQTGLVIPPGATCVLVSAQVRGNIVADRDSRLVVFTSDLGGNVVANRVQEVQIMNSAVHGGVVISGNGIDDSVFLEARLSVVEVDGAVTLSAITGQVQATSSVLHRSLRVLGNTLNETFGIGLSVDFNVVADDVTVSGNRGAASKRVFANQIGRTLLCLGNEPPFEANPFPGFGNTAGRALGQCAV